MIERLIKFIYKFFCKPILFRIDPENVHLRTIKLGKTLGKPSKFFIKPFFSYRSEVLKQNIFNLEFENPIGISAGFDKDGEILEIIDSLGFGFEVVGTVTLNAYEGNPKPRLMRLPKLKSIWVNYGLKNQGIEKILENVKKSNTSTLIKGISIGRTNSSETITLESGIEDYYNCFKKAIDSKLFDFYEINISCPNLYKGEDFSLPHNFKKLIEKISSLNIDKPIFIKMPISIDEENFDKLLKICLDYNINGVTIGNLNKNFDSSILPKKTAPGCKGGLSGKPTFEQSNKLIGYTYKKYGDRLKIIGVGGIFSAEDAYLKIKLGSSLVGLITGLIFEGPQLIKEIKKNLVLLLKRDGFSHISQAIGSYWS